MIRQARTADLSRIAEILVFGKRTAYRAIFRDDIGSFVGLQVLGVIEEYRRAPALLTGTLVFDDGIVKGMLRRENGPDGRAELCELYVEPCFTGMGIGRRLAERFLEEAARAGKRTAGLWVISENRHARRFYELLGFTPTGEHRKVEETAVDELRYEKEL